MTVITEIRTITPDEAQAILAKSNINNRNIRRSRVETYARDMKAKKWMLNGDSLKFNGNGECWDGQHRLMACVAAGKPFTTVVVTGLAKDAHRTIDTGAKRTLADELQWRGESNVADLAAVLNLIWLYDLDAWAKPTSSVPTRQELLDLLAKEPEIREAIRARPIGTRLKIRGTVLAATIHLICREHGAEVADIFLGELQSGTQYVDGDPCLALRNYAVNVAGNRLIRPNATEWFAVCIKAANMWLLGRPVKTLRWRRVGPQKEQFPQMVTSDMVGTIRETS